MAARYDTCAQILLASQNRQSQDIHAVPQDRTAAQNQSKMTLPASIYTFGQKTIGGHKGKRDYRVTVRQNGCGW